MIRQALAQKIVDYIKGAAIEPDKAFRYFVKNSRFELLDLVVGLRDALVVHPCKRTLLLYRSGQPVEQLCSVARRSSTARAGTEPLVMVLGGG